MEIIQIKIMGTREEETKGVGIILPVWVFFCNSWNWLDNYLTEDGGGARSKRKRKPSEKGMELQAEKVRKPLKSSNKSFQHKSKSVVDDEDTSNGFNGDYVSDESP